MNQRLRRLWAKCPGNPAVQLALCRKCPIPGCRNEVGNRNPCRACILAFGPYLQRKEAA